MADENMGHFHRLNLSVDRCRRKEGLDGEDAALEGCPARGYGQTEGGPLGEGSHHWLRRSYPERAVRRYVGAREAIHVGV